MAVAARLFPTKDLNFAAYLWTCPGVVLHHVDAEGRGRSSTIFFVFELPEGVSALAVNNQFYNGELRVDPLKFGQKQENLKDLLHMHRRGFAVQGPAARSTL
jgi:hypothetical protein